MYEELHSRGAHAELHMLAQAPHGEKNNKPYDRTSERFRIGKSVARLSRQILDLSLTSQVKKHMVEFCMVNDTGGFLVYR
eukprot:COSAG06_NODE_12812_length_1325_cov_1.080750_1_plen_80_part_00